jgi:anaerobic magnesium-protoporphyrin IX monomethyl ester cyclase
MDVLLAHSFFLKNDPKQTTKMRPYPPLGTLYAASALRQHGFEVGLFDAMLSPGIEEFQSMVEEHRPAYVVFYEDEFNFLNKMCLNHSRTACFCMTELARSAGCKVIASGSDVTDHPDVYLRRGVDVALLGEAEHALVDVLCRMRFGSGDPAQVDGVATIDPDAPGQIRRTRARSPERTPDIFPFPAWDLVPEERYRHAWTAAHGFFSVNMVTTRGCPFHCNWCAKPIWGQRYAMRSPANVAEEMALVKKTLGPDHIWFADDIFGLQPKWVLEFADEVEARQALIPFTIQTRADLMTEPAVKALARAGCEGAWLGAESGSQRILNAMDKGITVEQIETARYRLRDAGIRACFFIQFGYPGETFDDILETRRMVRCTVPDEIGVSVSNPLPGTKFYNMVKSQVGTQDHWEDSDDLAMLFQGTYTTEFYRKLHKLIHRDLDAVRRAIPDSTADLDLEWERLCGEEVQYRSVKPTRFVAIATQTPAPDLSRRWN